LAAGLEGLARIGAQVHLLMTVKSAEMTVDAARLSVSVRSTQSIGRYTGLLAAKQPQDVLIASDHCNGIC
jgi:hypothetical protein